MQADCDRVRLALTAIAVEAAHVSPSSVSLLLMLPETLAQIDQIFCWCIKIWSVYEDFRCSIGSQAIVVLMLEASESLQNFELTSSSRNCKRARLECGGWNNIQVANMLDSLIRVLVRRLGNVECGDQSGLERLCQ